MEDREKPIVAQKLYGARKRTKLSTRTVADVSKGLFKYRTLQSWEAGHREFPRGKTEIVEYLCSMYDISPNYLLDDDIAVNVPEGKRSLKPGEMRLDAIRQIPFCSSFPMGRTKEQYSFPIWQTNSARQAIRSKMEFEDLIKEGDILLIDDSTDIFTIGDILLIWRKNVLDVTRYDPNQEEVDIVARITGVFKDFDMHKSRND